MRSTFAAIAAALSIVLVSLDAQPSAPPPTNLWAAQVSAREITLVWTRAPDAVLHRIYEGTGETAKRISQTGSGDQSVQMVKGFGVEHRYSIEAVFPNGEVSARVPFNPVIPREVPPGPVAAPATATAVPSPEGITLTWNEVPGTTAYRIARRVAPGGFRILCNLCPTKTTFVDSTSTPGAVHTYMVTAVAPAGASRPVRSNDVTAIAGQPVSAPKPGGRAESGADATPPKGTITVSPVPNGCLSVGSEGNVVVRLADGTIQFFERVHFERGMRLVPDPTFKDVAGISNAVAARTSGEHTLVLLSDGTLRAFGMNGEGELGIGAGFYSGTPVAVREITSAVGIAVGREFSAALLADGTIRMWGTGRRGIPGDGQADVTTKRTRPATVAGIKSATAITAGALTAFALLADGTVRAWGGNFGGLGFYGVLGTGETGISSATPTPVIGVSNAVAISTSGAGSLALLADGRVMAWGSTRLPMRGKPEDYLSTTRALPVPDIRNAVALSPYLILLADGTVRDIFRPEVPVAGVANVVAVTSNPANRYALLADGRLLGWGPKQFWPKGVVTVAQFDAATAQQCAPRR